MLRLDDRNIQQGNIAFVRAETMSIPSDVIRDAFPPNFTLAHMRSTCSTDGKSARRYSLASTSNKRPQSVEWRTGRTP